MRYYVISDVHGYYTQMKSALEKAGFFSDTTPHKLIMLGDLFDRGHEAKHLQQFVLKQMEQDRAILIRGNHEDLFAELVTTDAGMPYGHHKSNGTYDTAIQLTGFDPVMASIRHYDFADAAKDTPFYKEIIPAMLDYFETPPRGRISAFIRLAENVLRPDRFFSDFCQIMLAFCAAIC